MQIRNLRLKSTATTYVKDGYDLKEINLCNVDMVSEIFERNVTYYIEVPCFNVHMSGGQIFRFAFYNMKDAEEERDKIVKEIRNLNKKNITLSKSEAIYG